MNSLDTLKQMTEVLGFHDLTSFFIALTASVALIAFIISCIIFLVKKRKERKRQLEKVVSEVQKEVLDQETPKTDILPITDKVPEQSSSLKKALSPTRSGFIAKLSSFFSSNENISEEQLEELESILFTADIGVKTAQKILDVLREKVESSSQDKSQLQNILKEEISSILALGDKKINHQAKKPTVIMFVGVNGAGKTTTIGKLAAKYVATGKQVVLGAGDTFRAAAVKQLSIWGERVGAQVVVGKENQDSASVLFDAVKKGQELGADYVLCDTAGRLHTKSSLMEELKKVYRVIGKACEGAPHEVYLVIDSTMGQNAIAQAREFKESCELTGIILSKLDGTAKGGVAIGIVDELKIPIRYIGVGEQENDLKEFSAPDFIEALFSEE